MLAWKIINTQKRLVLRLEALYLLKTYFAFSLVQYQNSDQEKKSFLKFSFLKVIQDLNEQVLLQSIHVIASYLGS